MKHDEEVTSAAVCGESFGIPGRFYSTYDVTLTHPSIAYSSWLVVLELDRRRCHFSQMTGLAQKEDFQSSLDHQVAADGTAAVAQQAADDASEAVAALDEAGVEAAVAADHVESRSHCLPDEEGEAALPTQGVVGGSCHWGVEDKILYSCQKEGLILAARCHRLH